MISAKSDVAESVYVRDLEMSPSKFVIARLLGRNRPASDASINQPGPTAASTQD